LAQAQSNRGRRGRKRDFPDAERLVKRLVARELTLSFVPDAEQRLWRTVTRKKYQLRRDHVRLQNQVESLLEEAHIKLSSLVSDLLGASARRMLRALAEGETNPTALAALADKQLRATPEQLCDALGACTDLQPLYRRLLKMALEQLQFLEQQIGQLDQEMASLLSEHQDAVQRLAEVPGLGVDSAQQIGWFDPVAEASQLPDDSGRALLLRLFGDGWAPFFVADSLVQDQPDQPTLSMGNDSDSLLMSETRYRAAIDNLENTSFGFYGGVTSLIE
jgi:transposase